MCREQFINDALVADTDDCIEWPYAIRQSSGYGAHSVRQDGKKQNWDAHRYACTRAHGASPEGYYAAHRCGNKKCVNPKHLYWATPEQNMQDAKEHGVLVGGGRYRQRIFDAERTEIVKSKDSLAKIAEKYSITRTYASYIRRQARQLEG